MKKVLLFSVFAFIACGNGNVDKVKNATLRGLDTMSVSAAIEGSKICKDIKYEDISKDGLNLVKISCAESSEQIKARNTELEEKYNAQLQRYNESAKKYENLLKKAIEKNEKDRDQAIARLQAKLEKSFTKNLSYDEIIKISMDNCKANAKNITECDDDGILAVLKTAGVEETKKGFWSLKSLLSNFAGIFGYHDEVLMLASRDRIRLGYESADKPKEAPSKPQSIKSVVRELSFIIKPDGSVEPKRDGFYISIDDKKEESGAGILREFYQR